MNNLRSSVLALAFACMALAPGARAQEGSESEQTADANSDPRLQQAQQIRSKGAALSSRLQGLLDGARRDGDIMKVTCLSNKLTEVNANLRGADQRIVALRKALAVGDEGRANHEVTVLGVVGQKLQVLDQEASQCVGQDLFEQGGAQVITETNPNVVPSEIDPTAPAPSLPSPPSVTVPPPLSPTM